MKLISYLGDFCDYFVDVFKFMMPYFVVSACLKYLGVEWLVGILIGMAVYLTIRDFECNELKRKNQVNFPEQGK